MESLHTNTNTAETALDANQAMLAITSKEEHRRLFLRGRKWLLAGLLLLGCSVGVNFLLFQSETSFTSVMYIMTSMGAVCVTKGLVDILGF